MLNSKGERELAYVVEVNDILPIEGADRVEVAVVGGWTIMVRKGQFKPGDLAVYFEIDSKVPEKEPFLFLADKHYKIKTQKYFKGTVISQGLLMAPADFGWGEDFNYKVGDFLTEELGVTYSVEEDNVRKKKSEDKYKRMAGRHPKLFQNPIIKRIYKNECGKKFLFFFFGKKKDKKTEWPSWVVKTDEERVQNIPYILKDKNPWVVTEKIDGTSTTFTIRRHKHRKKKYDFYVCSRNVVFDKPDKQCYYETNVYTEMAQKYDVENVLASILTANPELDWVTLQGETYGASIQKRNYGLNEQRFMGFNLITSNEGRWDSVRARNFMENMGIPWVPIIDENFILPDSVGEILEYAENASVIDGGMREGCVFRSHDGSQSFKAVSNAYLLKYHG